MAKREPNVCMPCRGSGQVISNLGGESRKIPCPWCGGSGVRDRGVDAQAGWLEGERSGTERRGASTAAGS
jgi:DnaJ-class molecular chaperone